MNSHIRFAVTLLATCLLQPMSASAQDDYERFAAFSRQTFGAAHEPLTYQLPGQTLAFIEDGAWQHVSENSAVIAVETNLPATVQIEYGPSADLGQKTDPPDRPLYLHIHTLRGLTPDQAVHYRVVATDERGNTIRSDVQTLTPRKIPGAIHITPEQQTPISLDQGGKTYVLTGDLSADGTALSVEATDVTVDLNGYTITYNNAPAIKDPSVQRTFGALATEGVQGIRCGYATRGTTRIVNGTIRQGGGDGGYGSVPLLMRGAELAGVTIDYHGTQVSGVEGNVQSAHHNIFIDRGTELTNRHQGVQCLSGAIDIHHNLFLRARQRGINGVNGSQIRHNEIYVDSCATNSFGIMFYKTRNASAIENRIFGTGYLAIGIGTVSQGVGDITVARNFIHMQATRPDTRWDEYGAQSGAYGVRVTWGGENIEYADNVLVSRGRDGGMVRGVWFCPTPAIENVRFVRNTIKVIAETPDTTRWGAIVVSGEDTPDAKPGLFEGNIIISNFCNVRLGEAYGAGRNARFVGNTFVRADEPAHDYATVVCGYGTFGNSGTVFLDSTLRGGADLRRPRWEGTGENGYAVGRTDGGEDVIEATITPGQSPVGDAGR